MELGVVLGTSQAEPGSAFPPSTPGFVVAEPKLFRDRRRGYGRRHRARNDRLRSPSGLCRVRSAALKRSTEMGDGSKSSDRRN